MKQTGSFKNSAFDETWTDWYYVESGGVLAEGLRTISGKRYYFKPYMATNEYITVDSVEYYFDKDGIGHVV